MLSSRYREKIDSIVDETIKFYKNQCFLNLPNRLRKNDLIEVQTAIMISMIQSMLQYLQNVTHSKENISPLVEHIFQAVEYHFKSE